MFYKTSSLNYCCLVLLLDSHKIYMNKRKNTTEQKNIRNKESIVCLVFKVGHADYVSDLSVCRRIPNNVDGNKNDLPKNVWQPYLAKYP